MWITPRIFVEFVHNLVKLLKKRGIFVYNTVDIVNMFIFWGSDPSLAPAPVYKKEASHPQVVDCEGLAFLMLQ